VVLERLVMISNPSLSAPASFHCTFSEVPGGKTMKNIAELKHANVQKKVPFWKETKELLENFVRPFNNALAELLGEKRFAWERSIFH
jgi:hypothetical protein